jgi:hypothetical protein
VPQLIERLSVRGKDLGRLEARVILVHGRDDAIVPYTESIALTRALRPGQARLYIIRHILTHVVFRPSGFFTRSFWTEDLPDLWRLYRAVYSLLAERDRAHDPEASP